MPTPSQWPISPSSSRAVWSPSRAASVISGPVRLAAVASDALEQVARDRGVGVDHRPGLAHERVAAGVLLPAAAVAALAPVPARDDLHVAELARDAEAAALHLSADEDAAADAGAEGHHHHVGLAARGAELPLRPDRGVGVVVDEDRCGQPLLQRRLQRLVPPGQVRGEDDGGAVRGDEPGGADADRGHVGAADPEQLLDHVDDRVLDHRRAGGPVRGVAPGPVADPPARLDQAAGDLGAADVDADREAAAHNPIPSAASAAAPIMPASLPRLARRELRLRPVPAAGELPAERGAGRVEQQVPRVGDAAADDDQLGVEDRGDRGGALADPRAEVGEQLQRGGVTLAWPPG